jgi:hypothetical protein
MLPIMKNGGTSRGEFRVGQVVRPARSAESKGRQNEYFNWKKVDFLRSTNLKLLRHIKWYSINNCDFFLKFVFSVRGGHCYCSSQASKNLAALLGSSNRALGFDYCQLYCSKASTSASLRDHYTGCRAAFAEMFNRFVAVKFTHCLL